MFGAVRLALGPVLLMQGRRVRRDILRMPEPQGPREGEIGSGPTLSLLILGDSSAAGVGVAHQDDALSGRLLIRLAPRLRVRWTVEAKTGWTTTDGLNALNDLSNAKFDVVVVSLGVNDVTTEVSRAAWLAAYQRLVTRLLERHGAKLVVASALPPVDRFVALPQPLRWYLGGQARAFDRDLARLVGETARVLHLPFDETLDPSDMAEDGFHPGPKVYDAWADKAAAVIFDWHTG